jgi:hypothetical protein
MKVLCWRCKGKGRLRDEPLTSTATVVLGVITLGMVPAMRALIESDDTDDRWWHDCPICDGQGWQLSSL